MKHTKLSQDEIIEIGRLFVREEPTINQLINHTAKKRGKITPYIIDKALESYFRYAEQNPSELAFIPDSWHRYVKEFSPITPEEEKIPEYVTRSLDKVITPLSDYGIDLKYINALKRRLNEVYEKRGVDSVNELTNFIINTIKEDIHHLQKPSEEKIRKLLGWRLQHVKKKAKEIIVK